MIALPRGIGVLRMRLLGRTVVVVSDRLSEEEVRAGRLIAELRADESDFVLVPEVEISLRIADC